VAAVSHEFRTPLASLRHVTELLDEDDELPRGERRTFYQVLGRNTERLNRLVESLLDFARMEGGKKPYALQRVDARALATRVASDFGAEVAPRGYRVDLDAEAAQGLVVEADAESLTHVLWNLLDNAVKYSPDRRDVVLSVRAHREGVAFAVTDHGLGIPAAERAEIFGRFVRGNRVRELGIKGTGLGLAMVQHIVQAHRGRVEVESQEGTGSTFRVVLPAAA
jgi:signal transduction histidine kinase